MKKNYRALWSTAALAALLAMVAPLTAGAQDTASATSDAADATADAPRVELVTNQGRVVIELFPDEAPMTVANFLSYVGDGFYDGTIFHRVIRGFMVQGGGFTTDMVKKETKAPVQNEADNGLRNERGTLAMARTGQPHSATAQFFINTVDNSSLDHRAKDMRGWGYTVFGKVVEGMEVVDAIESTKTSVKGRMRDVPVEAVIIESARVLDPAN